MKWIYWQGLLQQNKCIYKQISHLIQIFTDSKYVKSGITEWIHNWKKNGWKTANKKEVKNKELWTELDSLSNSFEIKWSWVKAHSSDKLNNEVDLLARTSANI